MDFCATNCVFPAVIPPTSQDRLSSVSKVAPPLFWKLWAPPCFFLPSEWEAQLSSLPSINGRLVGRYGLHASAAVGPCSARRWQPRFVGGNGSRLCDARQSQRCALDFLSSGPHLLASARGRQGDHCRKTSAQRGAVGLPARAQPAFASARGDRVRRGRTAFRD